ncbi:MAG: HpcH/HpaI aldolase family protein [Janthinobacterium lividum]
MSDTLPAAVAAGAAAPVPAMLKLAARLAAEGATFSAWVSLDPISTLTFARQDYDAITFDLQHGRVDLAATVQGIQMANGAGKPALARIPVGEFQTGARLLDAGASGIIAPMVNSVAEARAFVDFCKYPPLGARSFGAYAAMTMSGFDRLAFLENANQFCKLFPMIETAAALEALDDILAVDGIDGVFVGPADLSIGLTQGTAVDPDHPKVVEALTRVVNACRAAGKVAGVYSLTGEWAAKVARAGFNFIAVASDTSCLASGSAAAIKAARA